MLLWIILLILTTAVYFAVMIWIIPRLFLKSKYPIKSSCDRGIKKYLLDTDGHAVVYEPQPEIRKYIKQYLLVEQDGTKRLKCKINKEIFYLDFDVILFDSDNRTFESLHICDMIKESGYTQDVILPTDTACVSVFVNRVDNKVIRKNSRVKLSVFKTVCLWMFSIVASGALAMLLKLCIANLIGGVFRRSVMLSLSGNIQTLLVSTGIAVVCMLCLTFVLKKKKK